MGPVGSLFLDRPWSESFFIWIFSRQELSVNKIYTEPGVFVYSIFYIFDEVSLYYHQVFQNQYTGLRNFSIDIRKLWPGNKKVILYHGNIAIWGGCFKNWSSIEWIHKWVNRKQDIQTFWRIYLNILILNCSRWSVHYNLLNITTHVVPLIGAISWRIFYFTWIDTVYYSLKIFQQEKSTGVKSGLCEGPCMSPLLELTIS